MMTDAQAETCDTLWREALASGLAQYRLGMVTRGRHVIAGDDPLRVYTSGGIVRVSPADVRLDWTHPCNLGWLLDMAREATDGVYPAIPEWNVHWRSPRPGDCETEAEALLRTILATRGAR